MASFPLAPDRPPVFLWSVLVHCAQGNPMPVRRPPRHVFFAACPPGLETVLLAELRSQRFSKTEGQVGGVRFEGEAQEGWRAVLLLRSAVRVYRELTHFQAPSAEALYQGTLAFPWSDVVQPDQTFAIDAKVTGDAHRHSGFVALRVKDAVADWFRGHGGTRPSVDPDNPDVRLLARVVGDRCALSLDLAGRSLHRRGYRIATTPAPLAECLAAGAVLLSEWDQKSPFLDPFCGSGTLLIEAGLLACNVAPGLLSTGYGFERHHDFDPTRWEEMRHRAQVAVRQPGRLILRGWDACPDAVSAARTNVTAAGLAGLVEVAQGDIQDFSPTPGWGATVVSNPPYGVRLSEVESLLPLYQRMGRVFKERCRGYRVHLFLANGQLAKAFRLRPQHYWPVTNGGIPCRFARFLIR